MLSLSNDLNISNTLVQEKCESTYELTDLWRYVSTSWATHYLDQISFGLSLIPEHVFSNFETASSVLHKQEKRCKRTPYSSLDIHQEIYVLIFHKEAWRIHFHGSDDSVYHIWVDDWYHVSCSASSKIIMRLNEIWPQMIQNIYIRVYAFTSYSKFLFRWRISQSYQSIFT